MRILALNGTLSAWIRQEILELEIVRLATLATDRRGIRQIVDVRADEMNRSIPHQCMSTTGVECIDP